MSEKRSPAASAELLARWRKGDQHAAGELWRRYAARLISLARARLSKKLARHIDPEDLVQSAYRAFFVGARTDRYVLQHSGDLWRLLVAITLHKLQNQFRRHSTRKRTMEREATVAEQESFVRLQAHVLARDPSPEEAMALTDELELMMRRLDAVQQQIVELCLQGLQLKAIAAVTGKHEGTVRRNLKQVKQYLKRRCAESAGDQ
jgi:RNA polymerase sigma-70 factor (ECF subfamily)